MVYKPDPVYLKNDAKHPRIEADSVYSYIKPSLESLAPQSRSQSKFLYPGNGMDSNIIELPSIPLGWKCYSKPSTNLSGEMPSSSNRITLTCPGNWI
ncbi:hypothetical protein PMG11_04300 [Penicillium brasilianum]|uniref:Uncharacterized protein n=1 Tax=Penicillium brasilianum TaxID=104259 RepID=A0A0F7VJ05_PENBI|nr:hypothetical protein PMG11_04300 [Penicillium brasilianum]